MLVGRCWKECVHLGKVIMRSCDVFGFSSAGHVNTRACWTAPLDEEHERSTSERPSCPSLSGCFVVHPDSGEASGWTMEDLM